MFEVIGVGCFRFVWRRIVLSSVGCWSRCAERWEVVDAEVLRERHHELVVQQSDVWVDRTGLLRVLWSSDIDISALADTVDSDCQDFLFTSICHVPANARIHCSRKWRHSQSVVCIRPPLRFFALRAQTSSPRFFHAVNISPNQSQRRKSSLNSANDKPAYHHETT